MEDIRKNPGLYLIEGVFFMLLGAFAIWMPFISTLSVALILGIILMIGGIYRSVRAFRYRKDKQHFGLTLLSGLVALLVGILLVTKLPTSLIFLTIMLALFFLFDGISSIGVGLISRKTRYWGWFLFSGILALILAVLILSMLPVAALWIPGLLLGINLIITGASIVYAATTVVYPKVRHGF